MKKIIFLFFLLSANLFAQTSSQDEQFQKQIDEIMKARAEMLESLLNDSGELEKKMLEMMKRLSGREHGMGLGLDMFESPVVGQYDWIESPTHRTLKLKVKQIKDRPLDIKIEQGMIKIKGELESTQGSGKSKSVSRTHFQRAFSIPEDVDQTNPEFENIEGALLVKFKKITATKAPSLPRAPKKDSERMPITPEQDDLKI